MAPTIGVNIDSTPHERARRLYVPGSGVIARIGMEERRRDIRRAESPLWVKATKYLAPTIAPTSVAAFVIAPPLVRGGVLIGRIRSSPPSSVF
ncbi:unannotated protein [freshwater metagenome]|uniref:Unannotated protein n=1 Tax=freshwater metagenome TaxID=449393 RepID=A0A6J7MKD6_9ZZZZ